MAQRHDTQQGRSAEIAGYLAIGLPDEALRAARAAILQSTLTADDFQGALSVIPLAPQPKRWARLIKAAHRRLSVPDRHAVRLSILRYCVATGDYTAANRHLPAATALLTTSAVDLLSAMETCLAVGRLRKAHQVANACEVQLRECKDSFDFAALIQAVAIYAARKGAWEHALHFWAQEPADDFFGCEGLTGCVHIHTLRALVAVRKGLQRVAALKITSSGGEMDLAAPGMAQNVYASVEKELRWMGRALVRIVPPLVQQEFGLEPPDTVAREGNSGPTGQEGI
jgi:hypothetical protein